MDRKGLQVTTPTDTTIVMTRVFRAPRRLVYEAMFTTEKMRLWMLPPAGWTVAACECDARLAGALRLGWKSPDGAHVMWLYGVFTEVVANERAVHTEAMVLGTDQAIGSQVETHEFTEANGVTTMRITQVYPSKEARDESVSSGMEEGMEAGFERLDAMLAATL